MNKETLILLNSMAITLYNKNLCYVDGHGYYLLEKIGDEEQLCTFDGTTTLYPKSSTNFPKYYMLDNVKSVSELCRNISATMPIQSRNEIETISKGVGEITESEIKLAEKYNLIDFSQKLLGIKKEMAYLTYRLILSALVKAEMSKKSKTKIIEEFYNEASNAVTEKNFLKLENVKDNVTKHLGMQHRMFEAHHVGIATDKIWIRVKKLLIIPFIIVILAGLFLLYQNLKTSKIIKTEKNEQTHTYTGSEVELLIKEYCKAKDTTITDWRKNYVLAEFPTSELTDKECLRTLKYLLIVKPK